MNEFEGELMLTTKDNPYNPHEDYNKWRLWDTQQGYNTENYIARLIFSNNEEIDETDDALMDKLMLETMYSIIEHDPLDIYVLV